MVTDGRDTIKEITLCSKENHFPIRIKFVDKDESVTIYVLFKTRKEKLILQKPLLMA
jgi:hypothetical protein